MVLPVKFQPISKPVIKMTFITGPSLEFPSPAHWNRCSRTCWCFHSDAISVWKWRSSDVEQENLRNDLLCSIGGIVWTCRSARSIRELPRFSSQQRGKWNYCYLNWILFLFCGIGTQCWLLCRNYNTTCGELHRRICGTGPLLKKKLLSMVYAIRCCWPPCLQRRRLKSWAITSRLRHILPISTSVGFSLENFKSVWPFFSAQLTIFILHFYVTKSLLAWE